MPSGSHDINVKVLALMGIISTILVVSLVVATQAWFRYEFAMENQRKYIDVSYRPLVDLQQAQLAELNAPVKTHMVDGEEVVELTAIQWAMNEVVEQNVQQ